MAQRSSAAGHSKTTLPETLTSKTFLQFGQPAVRDGSAGSRAEHADQPGQQEQHHYSYFAPITPALQRADQRDQYILQFYGAFTTSFNAKYGEMLSQPVILNGIQLFSNKCGIARKLHLQLFRVHVRVKLVFYQAIIR